MKAYYSGAGWQVFEGECVATMRLCLPDNSVDSIVTDPPYDLTSSKRKVPAPHNEASPFSRHRMGVNGDTSPIYPSGQPAPGARIRRCASHRDM